jgi:hypothetical protein
MTKRKREPYASTDVPAEKTKREIRNLLVGWGCDGWKQAEDEDQGIAVVEFRVPTRIPGRGEELFGVRVRILMPLPDPTADRYQYTQGAVRGRLSESARAGALEKETRRRWRCLWHTIKAKLVAIDTEISTIEDEFEAWVVMPSGSTFRQHTRETLWEAIATGRMPALPEPVGRVPELGAGEEPA